MYSRNRFVLDLDSESTSYIKKEALLKKIGKQKHPEFKKNEAIRLIAFNNFKNEKFKKLSPVFIGFEALCKGASRYSAVITGSDQLWSPAGLPTNFYNLMFVPANIRKISIASSFGVKYIPWYQIGRTRKYLNRIEFISMRENRGSEIVKELTGKNVPTILDPVFFFNADDNLRRLAAEVCKEVNPDIQVFKGRIASGDQFVCDQDVKNRIVSEFSAYATEMEGAAIGQAAYLNEIPFLVVRAISDKADGSAQMDYSEFEKAAVDHSVRLTLNMLARI